MSRSSRALAVSESSRRPLAGATPDVVAASLFGGALSAGVFALYFLAVDGVRAEALATPSLVGAVLLGGASPLATVPFDLGLVGAFSLVHGALFIAFAGVAALTLVRFGLRPDLPVLALVLTLGLEGGFLAGTALLAPGLGDAIGHGVVLAGNALAGITLALMLRRELAD
jgi:hypothetical protein